MCERQQRWHGCRLPTQHDRRHGRLGSASSAASKGARQGTHPLQVVCLAPLHHCPSRLTPLPAGVPSGRPVPESRLPCLPLAVLGLFLGCCC